MLYFIPVSHITSPFTCHLISISDESVAHLYQASNAARFFHGRANPLHLKSTEALLLPYALIIENKRRQKKMNEGDDIAQARRYSSPNRLTEIRYDTVTTDLPVRNRCLVRRLGISTLKVSSLAPKAKADKSVGSPII